MKKLSTILLIAIVGLAACGESTNEAPAPEKVSWETFAATTISTYYSHNPEVAVYAGPA